MFTMQRQRLENELNVLPEKEMFFPVALRKVQWTDHRGVAHRVPNQYALVDLEREQALSIVSDQYKVITNQDAFHLADLIIQAVFIGATIKDFHLFNVYMPRTRSYCRMDLIKPQSFYKPFGDQTNSYTPFVRISNSYNKMFVLQFEIGFCRWICKNGCIFGGKSIKLSFTHTYAELGRDEAHRIIDSARHQLGTIQDIWGGVEKRLNILHSIPLPESKVLDMYCSAFGIQVDSKKLSDVQKANWAMKAEHIVDTAKDYFAEMGNNAYAMFNTLTDFASFPEAAGVSTNLVHAYQHKVGAWVDRIVDAAKDPKFSIAKFIGNEAMDTAIFLESLIKKSPKTNIPTKQPTLF